MDNWAQTHPNPNGVARGFGITIWGPRDCKEREFHVSLICIPGISSLLGLSPSWGEVGSASSFFQSLDAGTFYPHCPWQAGAEWEPVGWAMAPLLFPRSAAAYSILLLSANSVSEVECVPLASQRAE